MTVELDPQPQARDDLTVLHLEDDPLDAALIEARLLDEGLRVTWRRAAGRHDFLRALTAEPVDVILSDFALPGYSGLEALADATARRPTVPFLFVSGAIGEELAIDSLRRGATDYVLKDRLERLAPAVRRALRETHERDARRAASARAEALQALSEALSVAPRYADVARATLDQCAASLGATSCACWLASVDGALTQIGARGDALDVTDAGAEVLRDGQARWEGDAGAALPLQVGGRALGVLRLRFERPLAAEARSTLMAVARQCAQALDRARLYEVEREASRLKDEFLATVSHELRTPMTAILGWSMVLPSRLGEPERVRHGLKVIERNARAQARLIDDVLDVSRIVMGKLRLEVERVELPAVVRAALDGVAQAASDKEIHLAVDVPSDLGAVDGDPGRLQQIVGNIAWNAVKFTPRGGTVTVSAAREPDAVRLRVRDTGEGIAPEFLPHVFDRFRQADSTITRRYGGLGLGLAITRHLVELHGGAIHAESAGEGQGATFTVVLPLRRDTPAPEVPRDDVTARATGGDLAGLRVLLCEDEADAREFLVEFLQIEGAHVDAVASVPEALVRLDRAVPDVLVSDLGMPLQDGYTLIEQVRARAPERGGAIPAVALTGFARPEDARRARDAGFQVHLAKPVEPDALAATLARLCGR